MRESLGACYCDITTSLEHEIGACRADVVTDLDEETQEEKAAGQVDDPSFFLRQEGEEAVPYARRIFERVFCSDIERVLRMDVRLHVQYRATEFTLDRTLPSGDCHIVCHDCHIVSHCAMRLVSLAVLWSLL